MPKDRAGESEGDRTDRVRDSESRPIVPTANAICIIVCNIVYCVARLGCALESAAVRGFKEGRRGGRCVGLRESSVFALVCNSRAAGGARV